MPEPPPDLPHPLREALLRGLDGELPAPVAVMQLCAEAADEAQVSRAADALRAMCATSQAEQGERARAMLNIIDANPSAWRITKSVLAHAKHDRPSTTPEEDVAHWAGVFDRAARASPEGSVALYSLGNPELLRAATNEIVARMREWGLLGEDRVLLDIGCGIGRFEEALSPEIGEAIGVDVSREMVSVARRRCAALPNVHFLQTSGRDLSCFADGSFDLVLAVDVFPYLARSGGNLFEAHLAEAARVLKRGGDCLILNLAYSDVEAHSRRLAYAAERRGLMVRRSGTREFLIWDGLTFQLSKR